MSTIKLSKLLNLEKREVSDCNCNNSKIKTKIECKPETLFSRIWKKKVNSITKQRTARGFQKMDNLKSNVQRVCSQEKLHNKHFYIIAQELFVPITKAVTDAKKEILEHPKASTKQFKMLRKRFLEILRL